MYYLSQYMDDNRIDLEKPFPQPGAKENGGDTTKQPSFRHPLFHSHGEKPASVYGSAKRVKTNRSILGACLASQLARMIQQQERSLVSATRFYERSFRYSKSWDSAKGWKRHQDQLLNGKT